MANLTDTGVNGDLRVTGTMFGTQAGNYATCATAGATAAKTATISGFTLTTGIHVYVKFSESNSAAVGSLTLNVSGTGAKPIKCRGGNNLGTTGSIAANGIYEFAYDGTNWEMVGSAVMGVKGANESSYRWGNVNITAENVGAAASSHAHGNIANGGTLTDTAAAATGNDYVVIRDADNAKIQTSTIKGTDVADAVSKKHSHSTLTLSTTAQAYDGTHTLALPSSDPYTSARTPASHTHGNIANGGTLTDTAAAAAGNDYVVIRDADNSKIQTSTIKGTDVADAVSNKHSHSTLTLSTTAQAYDGTHTLALPASDPYTSARTPTSHTHGNITNDGKIGSTANLPVVTGTSGAVTTGTWATSASDTGSSSSAGSANTFSRGDHTHKVAVATGDSAGQVKVAGQNATVNGWDALSDRVENLEESGDVGFMGNATQDGERLIFEDIIFDSIYPSIGKYGLATFTETTSTDATEFSGDRDWLLDWRPYLIDMSPVAGETAKAPIAELRKDNWLRTRDGDYAPVCGITSAQSTALDGKKDTLYWKSGSTGDKVSATVPAAFDSSGKFVPAKFWEFVKANLSTVSTAAGVTYSSPIAVKVYVGTQAYEFGAYTNDHIPAPWETTETKYSVFIGRASDVYVVDGYSATTGEHMRGLCSKPLPVGTNKFDPEDYRLKRTGISPGPSTVVASKIRNFFYNYVVAASSNCTVCGNAGRTSIFYNNGTYPATNGPTQYRCADWSRACNSGGSSGNAVPVGEMGYHALNAFLCSVEAAYGTRNVWEYNRFSGGICANYSASATNGGVLLDGSTWKGWNTTEATLSSTSENYSVAVNGQYAKFQCMEPQIAASLATEMGISAGTSFHWNGGDWHFEVPSNLGTVKTLGGGAMNCRMYKLTDAKTVNGHTVRCNLVCALAEGVNPVGDIWWYVGGGAELVYLTDGTGNTNYKVFFYLEPDQAKWANTSTTEKITSGTFAFESLYTKLLDASTAGGLGNAYCLARTGYTPVRRVSGGAYNTGECTYQYRQIDDDAKGSVGIRSRRRLVFRGDAALTYCSPRYLTAAYRPSRSYVNFGCSAQVLLA